MKKTFKQYTAAMMAAILALSASGAALPVSAETDKKIVVIGDSISTGAGLASDEKSYVELMEDYMDVSIQNLAYDNCTTAALLDDLDSEQMQNALSNADVIVVTVGIHDIMDAFMDKAHELMEKFEFEKFSDVFTASLADHGLTEDDLNTYYYEMINALQKDSNYEVAAQNMLAIGEKLSVYTDAQVIYQSVYNCIDTIENFDTLSDKRQSSYSAICKNVAYYLNNSINQSLNTIASKYDCEVMDVYTAFNTKAYQYANLDILDMNPSPAGHQWIAAEVLATVGTLEKGDVNGDKQVDATDASLVLIHSAAVGAGGAGTLSERRQQFSDVNGDNTTDATDASKILIYSAKAGVMDNPTWD